MRMRAVRLNRTDFESVFIVFACSFLILSRDAKFFAMVVLSVSLSRTRSLIRYRSVPITLPVVSLMITTESRITMLSRVVVM